MKVTERSDDRLVLVDKQLDKILGIGAMSALLLFMAYQFASGGTRDDFLVALVPVAIVVGLLIYMKRTLLSSKLTLDRTSDAITLQVQDRKGHQFWEWKLSDLDTAELSELRRSGQTKGNGQKQPVMIMKDGTRVPMRPYHSAGGQSFNAVAAIQLFLGQDIKGAPVGWLNPFEDE